MSVGTLSLDHLREDGEIFMEEISREYYLTGSGLKATAALQPIYEKHADLLSPDALALTLEAFKGAAEGSEEQRSARLLLDWEADSQSARELAPLEEREIAWESLAIAKLPDGRGVQYQTIAIEMANAADRGERLALEAARADLVQRELAPLRRDRLRRERELTEALGLAPSYNAAFELLSGVSLSEMRSQCEAFLRDTEALWREVMPEFARRVLGIDPKEATRADAIALFRAREFDRFFPASAMESSITRQVREMGIDPLASGRVRLDVGEREGKRSRAFCAPVRVPAEVYLVLRPHGGQSDWTTFLHELGHALHFGYMAPDLPFEYRWLGDNAVTEAYAMLFDHRMHDSGWLKRYTEITTAALPSLLRSVGFEELHFLRRYCAKLCYEVELYGGDVRWESLPDLYVDSLTNATGFRYNRADAFVDVDPRYYSVRYLRAWQLQAQIQEVLVQRYDADWWRNPRAGPWIVSTLFAHGQREQAEEQSARIGAGRLSFGPLIRSVERLLA